MPKLFLVTPLLVACGHPPSSEPRSLGEPAVKLLTARFEPRTIRKIEVGDFHFTAGQLAPIHTHAAPALGYVSKGAINYQVEGQPMQVLHAGDAFFEPVGPRILHFDNASATDEAVFTDFNFERAGEPFIQFPEPPVDLHIDRRTFPTVEVGDAPAVGAIDIYAQTVPPGGTARSAMTSIPVMGYVASGTIEVGGTTVAAGQSFSIAADRHVANASAQPAKIITFEPVQ
jgi:quercetin dioxygenase-like cupin family protein